MEKKNIIGLFRVIEWFELVERKMLSVYESREIWSKEMLIGEIMDMLNLLEYKGRYDRFEGVFNDYKKIMGEERLGWDRGNEEVEEVKVLKDYMEYEEKIKVLDGLCFWCDFYSENDNFIVEDEGEIEYGLFLKYLCEKVSCIVNLCDSECWSKVNEVVKKYLD